MMHSFGEYPSEEKESLLSQILEDHPHPKYSLSARACQGILNRANRRGKQLPEQLEKALITQSQKETLTGKIPEIDLMIAENGIPKPLPSKNEPEKVGGQRNPHPARTNRSIVNAQKSVCASGGAST